MLVNPGDEVVLPVPYWVSFRDIIQYASGRAVLVPTDEEAGYRLRLEAVEQALTERTRLLILNSPSNPSGAVIGLEEFRQFYELAAARGVLLLSDECYSHFVYEGQPFSVGAFPGAREKAIVVGSLSKTFAMTGWRVGYALARPEIIQAMLKLQSHCTSNTTSIAQKAAIEALRAPRIRWARCARNTGSGAISWCRGCVTSPASVARCRRAPSTCIRTWALT